VNNETGDCPSNPEKAYKSLTKSNRTSSGRQETGNIFSSGRLIPQERESSFLLSHVSYAGLSFFLCNYTSRHPYASYTTSNVW